MFPSHGVALEFDDWVQAERARGRFYRLRYALRRAGDTSFDSLSFVTQPYGGLWIVRRDKLPRRDMEDGLSSESRQISRDELPGPFRLLQRLVRRADSQGADSEIVFIPFHSPRMPRAYAMLHASAHSWSGAGAIMPTQWLTI